MPEDEDRKAILARRNRLVAIALSGLASASTGCYEAHVSGGAPPPRRDSGTEIDSGDPLSCLGAPIDAGFDAGVIVGVCLSMVADAGYDAAIIGPCLGAPIDAGYDAAVIIGPCLSAPAADAGTDAAPTPCLDFAPEDAGTDAAPTPCLTTT